MSAFRPDGGISSWGGVVRAPHHVARPAWSDELPGLLAAARGENRSVLAAGLRRSYGDSGLNPGGGLIDMTGLDRLIAFDPATRLLTAEAGMSLDAILRFAVPRGFFLPVTPGTRFVTLGGAIANDVHGKNHHRNGTFGRWVRRLWLLRTTGEEIALSDADATGLFAATIGGLGLTGLITRAEIELVPIASAMVAAETIGFANLPAFFWLSQESEASHEYAVAWIDCLARGADLGRGLFIRGNPAPEGPREHALHTARLSLPAALPGFALNRHGTRLFNALHHRRGSRRHGTERQPLAPFFYPLDVIGNWNRAYGRRGFYQYQSVVPPAAQEEATAEMLRLVSASGQGSFLAVLKTFGAIVSPGFLSFPREGTTLALDLPNAGAETLALMARLDEVVLAAGGRLYPAKDGRMPRAMFEAGYPRRADFARHRDPGLSSGFWRRVSDG